MKLKSNKKLLSIILSLDIVTSMSLCGCNKKNKEPNLNIETQYEEISNSKQDTIIETPIIEEHEIIYTKEETKKTNEEIANEVINGLWGNNEDRINRLTSEGYNYEEIQRIVNDLIEKENSNNIQCRVGYLKYNSNLRTENGDLILKLSEYEKVIVYDEYKTFIVDDIEHEYIHICIPNMYDGYVLLDNVAYLPDTYIEVDISEQKLYMYKENNLVLEANVITGNPNNGNETDIGYTELYDKRYQTVLEKYNCYVDDFFSFNDTEGIHDADAWRSDEEYDIKDYYLTNGSHGCINMKQSDIDILDQYTSVGTKVLVHK